MILTVIASIILLMMLMFAPYTTTPAQAADRFGVEEIYKTSKGGDEWYLDNRNDDERFDARDDIEQNDDGSWKIQDDQVRMHVYTKSGYDEAKIETYEQKVLATKGYMQHKNDWKNVEITGYVKLNEFDEMGYFGWYARGGWHSHEEGQNGENAECEGTAYKPRIYYDGRVAAVKELFHNEGYAVTEREDSVVELEKGEWIGIKSIIYNKGNGVMQELWIDQDGDGKGFQKVVEHLDDGGWVPDEGEENICGGDNDQIITWGGPVATFRWDHASDVDVKWLSVREIDA
jgi:hypothetical protein